MIRIAYTPDRFWDMSPMSCAPSRMPRRTTRQRVADALYPVTRVLCTLNAEPLS